MTQYSKITIFVYFMIIDIIVIINVIKYCYSIELLLIAWVPNTDTLYTTRIFYILLMSQVN